MKGFGKCRSRLTARRKCRDSPGRCRAPLIARNDVGQKVALHYDGHFQRDDGDRSELTVLFYLNDNFSGAARGDRHGHARESRAADLPVDLLDLMSRSGHCSAHSESCDGSWRASLFP